MGFELLTEQVSITRTPEIAKLMDEAKRCSGAYNDREMLLASTMESLSKNDWQRLAHQFAQRQCVLRWIHLSPTAAAAQRLDVGTPSGLCVAVRRNERIVPVPEDGIGHRGDDVLIAAPVEAVPQWELWAGNSTTRSADQ